MYPLRESDDDRDDDGDGVEDEDRVASVSRLGLIPNVTLILARGIPRMITSGAVVDGAVGDVGDVGDVDKVECPFVNPVIIFGGDSAGVSDLGGIVPIGVDVQVVFKVSVGSSLNIEEVVKGNIEAGKRFVIGAGPLGVDSVLVDTVVVGFVVVDSTVVVELVVEEPFVVVN